MQARRRLATGLVAVAAVVAAVRGLPLLAVSQPDGVWMPLNDLHIARALEKLEPRQRTFVSSVAVRDRAFGAFLDDVRSQIPPRARLLVLVDEPGHPDTYWYRFLTAWRLAPRPVVEWTPQERGLLVAWRAPLPDGWRAIFEDGAGVVAVRDEP